MANIQSAKTATAIFIDFIRLNSKFKNEKYSE